MENMQSTEIQYVEGKKAEILYINPGGKYFCDRAFKGLYKYFNIRSEFFVLIIASVFQYLAKKEALLKKFIITE
jgi:hypothetical protein